MTDRKPNLMPVESWVDQQIREAERRGEFANLPGKGKPLPPVDTSDPMWWVKQKLEAEGLESPLHPALELRRDVARELAAVAMLGDERQVRAALELINARIRKANRTMIDGPPTDLAPVAIEAWIDGWRERRAARG